MNLRVSNLAIIVLFTLNISCTKSNQEPFSFAQLCDTQLGMGRYDQDVQSLKQAIKQINELNCDFVVICGDLVHQANDSTYGDFKEIIKEFNIPCYLVAGNHDVGNIPNDSTLNYYRETIGEDYYEFQNKGYSFIVTNTQLWKIDVDNESDVHDRWFNETLMAQSITKTPVFVVGHYPLYTESPDEEENYFNLPLVKRKEILKLFLQNKVVAYLSGHRHQLLINEYKNIQLVSGETTSKNFDSRPLGFRQWKVSADTLMHHFISLK